MKLKIVQLIILMFCSAQICQAQERTTNEAKIVVIINADDHIVSHIQMLDTFQKADKKNIFEKYPKHSFFYGVLKGKYELDDEEVLPLVGTTITVHTERQLFPEQNFYANKKLLTGDTFKLGKTKTEVIHTKKGELVLVTQ